MFARTMTGSASSLPVGRPLGPRRPPLARGDAARVQCGGGLGLAVGRAPGSRTPPETGRMLHTLLFAALTTLGQVPELNDQSFERWRDYVRPQAKEESYL